MLCVASSISKDFDQQPYTELLNKKVMQDVVAGLEITRHFIP